MPPSPILSSPVYGGSPNRGDITAPIGSDAVVSIGGKNSQIYEIDQIILSFAIDPTLPDWQPNIRSFSSRLTVVENLYDQVFTPIPNVSPNTQLFNSYPNLSHSDILLDMMVHKFDEPLILNFPLNGSIGGIRTRSGGVTVIALNPTSYDAGGVARSVFNTSLHVIARLVATSEIVDYGRRQPKTSKSNV